MKKSDSHTDNDYFKLLLLKVVQQITESWGVLVGVFHRIAESPVKTFFFHDCAAIGLKTVMVTQSFNHN